MIDKLSAQLSLETQENRKDTFGSIHANPLGELTSMQFVRSSILPTRRLVEDVQTSCSETGGLHAFGH